jgi:hypothetical protein
LTGRKLGVHPDAVAIAEAGTDCTIPARIVGVEHLGGSSLLYVQVDGLDELLTAEQRGKADFFAREQKINPFLFWGSRIFRQRRQTIENGH